MKKLLLALASTLLLISTGVFVACSSGEDGPVDEGAVLLKPNKPQIAADGTDAVTFMVTKGSTDITNTAEIWKIGTDGTEEKLAANRFQTTTSGIYNFEARYTADGQQFVSPKVSIIAGSESGEVFYRKVFMQQLTSVNCINCPMLTSALDDLDKSEQWQDRMVRASFHDNYNGADPMHLDVTGQYGKRFNIDGLPACISDLRVDTHVTSEKNKIEANLERILAHYPATCGVAIESKYNSDTRRVDFTVKVKASSTNEYRLLIFLVEDGIKSYQLNGDANYVHNNTVRVDMSSSLLGDKLGTIEANSEQTKNYWVILKNNWEAKNMRIVACALAKDGDEFYGNNSATCPIAGSIDYILNK